MNAIDFYIYAEYYIVIVIQQKSKIFYKENKTTESRDEVKLPPRKQEEISQKNCS